ncbi:ABC transporter permease subunit [Acidipila sp. EB88]|uniref:ABC transporter permease n=1 Tax=Acidipila sp. EB88 TaxID=2305226 RepID=UPI000F5D711A|nr:ABC transporter permease subunit [Acidipila sp. EB88]RRA49401.1 ABC transporter permease subunit [Acidipila sp. EB88]
MSETQQARPPRLLFSRAFLVDRSWPIVLDLGIGAALIALFYGVLLLARYWSGTVVPESQISLAASALPRYAFYSCARILLAYLLSLAFAIGYGYLAAYNKRAEAFLIATLDILQSIPVMSFLPPVILAMMTLIPTHQLGIELGDIVVIFTGMVWNMAFSFYASLKAIPRELQEACKINRFSPIQRAFQLELPFAAIGLVWNSMISVANGWFALMICEMFNLGSRNFRLPGLGSYLATAASMGDNHAMARGLITVVVLIVAIDQLIWRPLIAWSDKFKFENVENADRSRSPILDLLRRSNILTRVSEHTLEPLSERMYAALARGERKRAGVLPDVDRTRRSYLATAVFGTFLLLIAALTIWKASLLVRGLPLVEYRQLLIGAGATFLRVIVALVLAAAWTIPAGVMIGFNPRLARIAQPFAQIAASFPATALFPLILVALLRTGAGLGLSAVVLMMLSTQWYIFFNVIAGAMAIPSDLKEVSTLFGFSRIQRWRTLILPGIFPYLITGLITASGGAWNASILTEYFKLHERTLSTVGLGAQIDHATDTGNFAVLLMATVIMALIVVTINRLLWRPLNRLAETKYRLE